jgi:hypothetical protein
MLTSFHLPRLTILLLYTTQSLRGNYLQADAFFANPERHDCEDRGVNSCSRLPHCAQELDSRGNAMTNPRTGENSCLELVNRCSDATWTICENAVQMSSSSRTHQHLALCEWSGSRRNGSCIMPDRRRDRTYVSVEQSRNAAPRTVNSLPR